MTKSAHKKKELLRALMRQSELESVAMPVLVVSLSPTRRRVVDDVDATFCAHVVHPPTLRRSQSFSLHLLVIYLASLSLSCHFHRCNRETTRAAALSGSQRHAACRSCALAPPRRGGDHYTSDYRQLWRRLHLFAAGYNTSDATGGCAM